MHIGSIPLLVGEDRRRNRGDKQQQSRPHTDPAEQHKHTDKGDKLLQPADDRLYTQSHTRAGIGVGKLNFLRKLRLIFDVLIPHATGAVDDVPDQKFMCADAVAGTGVSADEVEADLRDMQKNQQPEQHQHIAHFIYAAGRHRLDLIGEQFQHRGNKRRQKSKGKAQQTDDKRKRGLGLQTDLQCLADHGAGFSEREFFVGFLFICHSRFLPHLPPPPLRCHTILPVRGRRTHTRRSLRATPHACRPRPVCRRP